MAKTLSKKPPTSSVARLFDQSAVSRALTPTVRSGATREPIESQDSSCDNRAVQPAVIKREFVLTPTSEDTLTRLVQVYRNATGTRLSNSHVMRIVLRGVAHGLSAIQREANLVGSLKLPSNARGREAERVQFEKILAASFIAAMRTLPALEFPTQQITLE